MISDRDRVVEALLGQVAVLVPEAKELGLTETSDLRDFASFDSIAIVQLLTWIEETYEVSMVDDEDAIGRVWSVHDLADYLLKSIRK